MPIRRQLPAWSPLPLRAVLAAAAGVFGDGGARSRLAAGLAATYDAADVLLTDSGTGALMLAIRGALAGRGDAAVALPAYGCYDLATAADGAGVPVVLYDLDPATLAPVPESVRRALDLGARAFVLVHLYGIPADPALLAPMLREAGALLLEDAAQGAGGSLRGRPLGAFGDVTVLSFGRGKGNTAGKGGALLACTDAGVPVIAHARTAVAPPRRGLGEVVQLKAQWLLGRPSVYGIPASLPFLHLGATLYHAPPTVRVMSAPAARALEVTLLLGQREAERRRANAARLLAACGPALTRIGVPAGGEAGYLRLPLVVSAAQRAKAESGPAARLGIMPGYPRALCDLPGFGARVRSGGDGFDGARTLAARAVTLPTHSLLKDGDLATIEAWVTRW